MKLSIIIPCLNEAPHIEATLEPLQQVRSRGHEVIVCDGGSTDNTLALTKNLADQIISAPKGRASQMNAAANIAQGNILCFLHADTLAPDNIDQLIINALSNTHKAWGRFNVRLSSQHWPYRIIEWFMNWRSCLTGIATGDQGIFIDKNTFEKLNGFSNIPLMEDIELSKRLKKHSHPSCIKTQALITSSRRWQQNGLFKTVLLMWKLRLLYFLGVSANTLAAEYRAPAKSQMTSQLTKQPTKQASKKNNRQLILFIKSPEPGQCKTRLIPLLGEVGASEFYQQLVMNCLKQVSQINNLDIALYVTPDIQHPFIKQLTTDYAISLHKQQGSNLGERMHKALQQALHNYNKVVLCGTDIPLINSVYIEQAFQALNQHDIVIGPAEDGGYVLIGATETQQPLNANLFSDIEWSTDRVLQQTLSKIENSGYSLSQLPTLWDIDTPQDFIKHQPTIKQLNLCESDYEPSSGR